MPGEGTTAVVIGVGNPDRGDDGVGVAVARQVRCLLGTRRLPPGLTIRVLERCGDLSGLLEAWEGAATAILIDAVRSGGTPGVVHRIDGHRQPIPHRGVGHSAHAIGLAEAVALARVLGRMPARLILYGIEGKTFDAGASLSAEVSAAVPATASGVLEDILASV